MSIGAVGAYGVVSALSFRPYVYNTNTLNAASMNKLSRISDDVLERKTDYSELTDESLNVNPLRKGQTLDFQGILDMQMRRGQNNAARIMRPMSAVKEAEESVVQQPIANPDTAVSFDVEETLTDEIKAEANAGETVGADGGANINYQMRQALRAYEMFMTA